MQSAIELSGETSSEELPELYAVKELMTTDTIQSVVGQALLRLQSRDAMAENSSPESNESKTDSDSTRLPSSPAADARKKSRDDERVNRRRLPRRAGRCSVTFCYAKDRLPEVQLSHEWPLHAANFEGTLTDLSLTGIAFVCEHSVPSGVMLLMSIANRQLDFALNVVGRVVRVSSEPDNRNRVVCVLQRPLSYREYDRIGWSQMPATIV